VVIERDEEPPRSALQLRLLERQEQQKAKQRPSIKDFDAYCDAHLGSMAQVLGKDDISKLTATMIQNPKSKDRLKVILEHMPTFSLTSSQMVEIMRMVSSDDHKRKVMIEMYSHLTDREHFEEQVVHQFSLSDTMRTRTLEMLHERLAECSKDHAETGILPVVATASEAPPVNSTASANKTDDVAGTQEVKDGGQDGAKEALPASAGWCLCCTGSTTADDSKEQVVDQVAEYEPAVEEDETNEGEVESGEAPETKVNLDGENDAKVVVEDGEGEAPQKIGAES